jgi:hypothetical protein
MRTAFVLLTLALIGAGYQLTRHEVEQTSITVKLPPAVPAISRPGFRF